MCLTVPGRIVSIEVDSAGARVARVDYGATVRPAHLLYTPEVEVGDFVIVQAGFATRRLDEAEAREALEYHRELDRLTRATEVAPSPPRRHDGSTSPETG